MAWNITLLLLFDIGLIGSKDMSQCKMRTVFKSNMSLQVHISDAQYVSV